MLRALLEILPTILLVILLARAVWRAFGQAQGGAGRSRPTGTPEHGERMVRDPVCGTFVLPSRALSVGAGNRIQYFCSERCRAVYQAGPVAGDTQPDAAKRRGA